MFQTQQRLVRATTTITGLSLIAACMVADPASARQDFGPGAPRINQAHRVLARVGTQYVVGDDLTGNGVPAPGWIRRF